MVPSTLAVCLAVWSAQHACPIAHQGPAPAVPRVSIQPVGKPTAVRPWTPKTVPPVKPPERK